MYELLTNSLQWKVNEWFVVVNKCKVGHFDNCEEEEKLGYMILLNSLK